MKQVELIFATHNPNKLKEIQEMLPSHIKLLSLTDLELTEEIPETSDTLEGNAKQKMEFVRNKFGKNCFADDTGLEVEALNGAPGVYSARYAGKKKNNEANIEKLLLEMKGKNDRKASFRTIIALYLDGTEVLFPGSCSGTITNSPRGEKGFGYDSVFQPTGFSKTFAEMEIHEKVSLSHRSKAVQKLIDYLSN